jgi:hypothetical protein
MLRSLRTRLASAGAIGGIEEVDTQEQRKTATHMELERARVLSAEARPDNNLHIFF